jgi:hypothetical protein
MGTKYIVNNVSGQTITGDLTINGNVIITGTTNTNGIATYRALMTQTGSITGYNINDFNGGLVIGEEYSITNYVEDADFSNIANVQSGTINQTGCVFIATGETPNSWADNTELTSNGGLVVNVLENSLGYDIDWEWAPFGGYGYYIGVNATTGPLINSFPRNNVDIKGIATEPFNWYYFPYLQIVSNTGSINQKDDLLNISVLDLDLGDQTNDALYYTPIEINIKQDLDITPFEIWGEPPAYPIANVSYNLYCGPNIIETYYSSDGTAVNDDAELIALLNSNINTNQLGTFTQGPPLGLVLTMPTNLKNQFCPSNTLSFQIFED